MYIAVYDNVVNNHQLVIRHIYILLVKHLVLRCTKRAS